MRKICDKFRLLCILCFALPINIIAQDVKDTSKLECDVTCDFVSAYLWRGQALSKSPCIQPSLSFTYKNLNLTSWGSHSLSPANNLDENQKEIDFFLSYNYKALTFSFNDYFIYDQYSTNYKYFNYDKKITGHTFEGVLNYSPESIPISLTAASFIYGPDTGYGYKEDKDNNGDNYYSSYFELAYSKKMKDKDLSTFIGITPSAGYYGEKFGFVNVGLMISKNIELTQKFSLPLKCTLMANPQADKIYLAVGITL